MNIFAVNDDPALAARDLCNQHVHKMALESTQMLCTVLNGRGVTTAYKSTHQHHPCTKWVAETPENFAWLYSHATALFAVHHKMRGKPHACAEVVRLWVPPRATWARWKEHTPFVQAMPERYRGDDAVQAYRRYYVGDKLRFATWEPRETPEWVSALQNEVTHESEK